MPLVAAAIGFGTKIVAIKMMFQPIKFVGWPPFLGWQGIVPRKASVMASIACDTMTEYLIKPKDIFMKLDPQRVAQEIEGPLLEAVEDITREVAAHYQPGLWEMAPDRVKQMLIARIKAEAPKLIEQIMLDIQNDIDRVFDLKDMVVTNLTRDVRLLNRIFLEAGHAEFRFIRHSGIYFGFLIGLVQASTWAMTHQYSWSHWLMPAFGGFTGWFTDWLALKMIFNPKEPKRYLGIFEWHGLFLKHRKEVAAEYGRLIAREIITPDRIIDAILRGPMSDRMFSMVQKQVQRMVDQQAGLARPLVVFSVGSRQYQEMKKEIARKVMERLPQAMKSMEAYAADAIDIENTLVSRMQELTPKQFEGLLRPAFEQDEWILIAVGAALGFIVGEFQVQVMIHFASAAS